MIIQEDEYLMHYGILRKSGRYPWGSGENPETRSRGFLGTIDSLKKQGLSDNDIALGLDLRGENGKLWNSTDFRTARSLARTQTKQADIRMAQSLKNKGYKNTKIGERMGINESSVRSLLAPGVQDRIDINKATTNMLRDSIDKKKYVDVGGGTENQLGISDTKLKLAIASLREEGYKLHYVKVPQLGTGKYTTLKVMSKPDVPYKEVYQNRAQIKTVQDYTPDSGRTYFGIQPPLDISSSRVGINYKEDGGDKADGVMYIRRGVDDLTLGKASYAQVRVSVDGTHYIKGMAMYRDDLPKGVDILFNTNKSDTGNKLDALKLQKDDPDNPFGAVVHQLPKLDKNGVEIKGTVRSAMNIVNEEGDWETWSKSLSSQFLSKQSPVLAKTQLGIELESRKASLAEINGLTNPAVKKKLLDTFADDSDSAAVQLKAAALPRQSTRVILPVESLKDNEVYAPTFRNGEQVVLIRHPHGGTFEIPKLIVNNNHPEAKSLLGQAEDAIAINSKVASRLSGADFDGDQVLVIPNDSGKVKSTNALEGLKKFDPQSEYPAYDGMRTIDGGTWDAATKSVVFGPDKKTSRKQNEMGNISNLITDMTIKGANTTEIAAAVRHSMVVIDAEKHHLDVKASAVGNSIRHLKEKYQSAPDSTRPGGASTLISRATSDIRVNERKQGFRVDPDTGKKIYTETGASYTNKDGKLVVNKEKSTRLAETDDARTLVSEANTPIEKIYSDYSNQVKALANQARLDSLRTKNVVRSPTAAKVYSKEVDSLEASLQVALKNRPLERQAQVLANAVVDAKKAATPDMDKDSLKKIKGQALTEARTRVGAKKVPVTISDEEWEAIQNGAISNNKLKQILDNTDIEQVKQRATPRQGTVMTDLKIDRAKQLLKMGYTQAQIADDLGVNPSTLSSSLKGAD